MAPSHYNPTGFNRKTFAAASSPNSEYALRDPWRRAEQWRYYGPFSRWNRFKGAFPGLGIATVAFAGYCAFEWAFLSKEEHHGDDHGDGHGGEHQ